MSSPGVTLYLVRVSPPCRAVWLYILQHKIPHKLVDVDFSDRKKVPDVIIQNAHQEVPILTDGDVLVFEGSTILRYLANKYTNSSGYGIGLAERMLSESLISWASNQLHRVIGYQVVYPQMFEKYRLPTESATATMIESGIQQTVKFLDIIENSYLSNKRFMSGSLMTVADSYVATIIILLECIQFSLRIWPRIVKWLDIVKKQNHWTEVHLEHQELVNEIRNHTMDY